MGGLELDCGAEHTDDCGGDLMTGLPPCEYRQPAPAIRGYTCSLKKIGMSEAEAQEYCLNGCDISEEVDAN